MVKITIGKGKWNKEQFFRELRWEACPNPRCRMGELHYPDFLETPSCPECKTKLIGAKKGLEEGYGKRIAYHLEEI